MLTSKGFPTKLLTFHGVKASMSPKPTSLVGLAHKAFKTGMIP